MLGLFGRGRKKKDEDPRTTAAQASDQPLVVFEKLGAASPAGSAAPAERRGLNLSLKPGAILSFLGSDPAALRGLARAITGGPADRTGRVLIDGTPLEQGKLSPTRVWRLEHDARPERDLKLRDHLQRLGREVGIEKGELEARVAAALAAAGLEDAADAAMQAPETARDRFVFARVRALLVRPRLLVIEDAPFDPDPAAFTEAGIGAVVLLGGCAHLALAKSAIIAVLDGQDLVQLGTPMQVYDRPRSVTVARLTGEANILPAICREMIGSNLRLQLRNGQVIAAQAGGGVGSGSEVTLMIRPEGMELVPPDDEEGQPATIEAHHYEGPTTRFEIRLSGGQRLVVRMPNGKGIPRPARKERVSVRIHAEAVRVVLP